MKLSIYTNAIKHPLTRLATISEMMKFHSAVIQLALKDPEINLYELGLIMHLAKIKEDDYCKQFSSDL